MMFNKALMLAAGLLPTAFVLAQVTAPDFKPGRCTFDAKVHQDCEKSKVKTMLAVSPLYDDAGKPFMEQTNFIDLTDGKTLKTTVLGKDFKVGFKDNSVEFTYDGHFWRGGKKDPKFSCWTEQWTDDKLVCGKKDHRSQALHCAFDCAAPKQIKSRAERALPPILAREPAFTSLSANISMSSKDFPYAPGICRFNLQLFNQCLHSPEEDYSQMLGMIYSIRDDNNVIVATYPEGAGRLDARSVALQGIGELRMGYNTDDNQMYFAYLPVGGWWSTGEPDDGDAKGMCRWGAWTREAGACDDSEEAYNDHPRVSFLGSSESVLEYVLTRVQLSEMSCVFHC
jgi:hypothetical protein